MSISTFPSPSFLTSYSLSTPVAANVFVLPDLSLATIFQFIASISPLASSCVNSLNDAAVVALVNAVPSTSGPVNTNVPVNQLSPLPYVYKTPPSVVAVLSSGLPI